MERVTKWSYEEGWKSYDSLDNKLFLLGGAGIPSGPIQPGSEFILDEYANDGSGWTNEIHSFDLTKGE